jgi:hypothetical protein
VRRARAASTTCWGCSAPAAKQAGDVGRAILAVAVHDQHRIGRGPFDGRAQADGNRPLMTKVGREADHLDRSDAGIGRQDYRAGIELRARPVIDGVDLKGNAGAGEQVGNIAQQR